MHQHSQRTMFFRRPARSSVAPRTLLQKVALAFLTAGAFVLALMFSVVLFAVVVTVGVVCGGYVWWKLRRLRKQVRTPQPDSTVIEGVGIREVGPDEEAGR